MYIQLNTYLKHLAVVSLLCCSSIALAVDGVIEINQARALAGGITLGDTPGFPVTLSEPGSYRLTGNLDLSAQSGNVSGIVVSAPAVTVDLGGFQIAGPTTCSGSGTTINCSPPSTGVGSYGVWFTSNAPAGVVQNGFVRNMKNFGILGEAIGLRVQGITARHNGGDGIRVALDSLVTNSVAIENVADGLKVYSGSVIDGVISYGNGSNGIRSRGLGGVVTRISARRNGLSGFNLGPYYKFGKNNTSRSNELDDRCGEGICTEIRRFYLTKTTSQGSTVLTACAAGFHTASVVELRNLDSYIYDYILGTTRTDSGAGAPVWIQGWVRAGTSQHCDSWTSNGGEGPMLELRHEQIPEATFLRELRFSVRNFSCSSDVPVWCIEGEGPD